MLFIAIDFGVPFSNDDESLTEVKQCWGSQGYGYGRPLDGVYLRDLVPLMTFSKCDLDGMEQPKSDVWFLCRIQLLCPNMVETAVFHQDGFARFQDRQFAIAESVVYLRHRLIPKLRNPKWTLIHWYALTVFWWGTFCL